MGSPEEGLRDAAVAVVGWLTEEVPEQVPVEPLVSMLQASEAGMRATAARALGRLGARIPIEPLVAALQDEEASVRLAAIRALANASERMPQAALRPWLEDLEQVASWAATKEQATHWAAVKALVRVGDPMAVAATVASLHADHEYDRENALVWLVESTDREMREIAQHLPMEELTRLLPDAWWPVGHMAARMIATLEDDAPFAELLALLTHPAPEARWASLHALALLGKQIPLSARIPIEPVLHALDAEDVETRRGAAEALDQFGPAVPVERLIPLLEVEDVCVARTVAKRGRQEGIDALVASLRTRMRAWQAATALGDIGAYAPAEPLVAALHYSDWTVRFAAAEALYQTHPEILPQLVPELVETLGGGRVGPLLEPLRRVWMVESLYHLRSPQPAILNWLNAALDDPVWEVRSMAALGLGQIQPIDLEATREKLQRLLDDPELDVRDAAHYTLTALAPQNAEAHHESDRPWSR
jgi:HEAT repeat protein